MGFSCPFQEGKELSFVHPAAVIGSQVPGARQTLNGLNNE